MQVIAQGYDLAHQRRALVCGARHANAIVRTQRFGADAPLDEALRLLQVVLDLDGVAVVDGVDEVQAQAPAIQSDVGNRPCRQLGVTTQINFNGNLFADIEN